MAKWQDRGSKDGGMEKGEKEEKWKGRKTLHLRKSFVILLFKGYAQILSRFQPAACVIAVLHFLTNPPI